jgi:hypothetical protein
MPKNNVQISNIEVSPPKAVSITTIEGEATQQWMDIDITIKNLSSKNTYYVVSNITSVHYDSDTLTLFIDLTKDVVEQKIIYIEIFNMPTISVLPRKTAVIHTSVPLVIKQIRSFSDWEEGKTINVIDVSGFQRINCRISYDSIPFPAMPSEITEQMVRQLSKWGKTIKKTFSVSSSNR